MKALNKKDIYLYNRPPKINCDINMWFAFPGPESFALSSLGYLWLFKTLDMEQNINIEMINTETCYTVLKPEDVNLIAFSFNFDMDFLNILTILEKYGLKFKSKEREDSAPLVFAGGPVITANPEPYREIFDFMILGDGEEVNLNAVRTYINNKDKTKSEILAKLSEIEGIYVPSCNQKSVNKSTKKLNQCIYTPIISENSYFKDTFILEVERGCANRCGFCLASYINLPIRFVKYEQIIEAIELGLNYTNKIALLGAQITAHPDFERICSYISEKNLNGENIEAGVSSLRVDSFKREIVKTLVNAGQKNLTLAIEAGSERLRKVINKNLKEEQIFNAIDVAKECGLNGIKFYAMIGLPTETMQDIEELVILTKKIKEKYKGFNISYGFSTFVPKANTPFQWFGRECEKALEQKTLYLKKNMHKLGVQISVSSAKWDYWQAVLSRGDANLTDFIIETYKNGGKLGAFKKAAKELSINTDYYALQNYEYNKKLPWDFININPGKEFLIEESKRLIYNGT